MDTDMEDLSTSPHGQSLQLPEQPHLKIRATDHDPRTNTMTLEEFDKLWPIRASLVSAGNYVFNSKPVPLPPTTANSEAVTKFTNLCQLHSFMPDYTIEEVSKGRFSSKVKFGDQVCEDDGPFTNKKLAKEAVAQRALDILKDIELPKKDQQTSKTKRKSPTSMEENWINILNTFAQQNKHQLQFQLFEADNRAQQLSGTSGNPRLYSCTLQLPARPLHTFGSDDSLHATKAEAKRLVAREAVLWLRTVELLPDPTTTAGNRRKLTEGDVLTRKTSTFVNGQSPAQAVHDTSLRLGFSQPQFELKPCATQDNGVAQLGFYSCAAKYLEQDVQRERRLTGPLCQTAPVFGQKNAKSMCCQALLGLLEQILTEVEMEEQ